MKKKVFGNFVQMFAALLMCSCNDKATNPVSPRYTLTINSINGTVIKSPDKISYSSGDTVTLSAVPSGGYTFSGWSGDATGTNARTIVVMNGNRNVVAAYAPIVTPTYLLTITATNGTVTKFPDKTVFDAGETVSLTAHPENGYSFAGWSGGVTGTGPTVSIVMDGDKLIYAAFQTSGKNPIGTWAGSVIMDTLGATITVFMKLTLNANQTFKDSLGGHTFIPGFIDTTFSSTSQGTWRDMGNNKLETTNTACTEDGVAAPCSSVKDTIDASGINGNTWTMTDQDVSAILTRQ